MTSRQRSLTALSTAALLASLASWGTAFLPEAPLAFDEPTLFLASFDSGTDGVDREGPNGRKNTLLPTPDGVFGTPGVEVPASGAVALYDLPEDFDPDRGTIEMWVKAPDTIDGRATLMSLEGRRGLGNGGRLELIIGEEDDGSGRPTRACIYSGTLHDGELFTRPTSSFPSATLRGVTSGDIDGDGNPDLVCSMYEADEVQVFLGPFDDHRRVAPDARFPIKRPQGLSLVDFDDDGDLDFLVASFADDTPPFYGFENDGSGNFTVLDWGFASFPPVPGGEGTAVGDVDGDGVLDVLVGVFSFIPAAIWYGSIDASGRYQITPLNFSLFAPNTLGADLADLNDDGWLDVVLSRPGGITFLPQDADLLVYYNQGGGVFPTKPDLIIPSYGAFTFTAQRDLNHDGHRDIAVASLETTHSRIHYGPDFVNLQKLEVEDAVSVTVADLDNDGLDDVFFRSRAGDSPLYFLGEDGEVLRRRVFPRRGTVVGMGSHVATAGTTPYGTTFQRANSFEIRLDGGTVVFEIVDSQNRLRQVHAPYPEPLGGTTREYQFLRAEWDAPAGVLRLSVGDPSLSPNPHVLQAPAFEVGPTSPVFHLGTGVTHQSPARGWKLDDVRFSELLRGDHVCQKDLGLDGPGELELEVCGQYLRPGNTATFELRWDQPDKIFFLIVADQFNPVFVSSADAFLLSTPWLSRLRLKTDPGGVFRSTVDGNLLSGQPQDLYLQAFGVDPGTTKGVAVSNILEVKFQAP